MTRPGGGVRAQSSKSNGDGAAAAAEQNVQFGGTYANLKPAQRRLVDEWFRQYNEVTKRSVRAADGYDSLSLSSRTTFEAVTHALMRSKLTGQNNRPLGTALDLISYVETVHGKIPEARGDLQFRMYAALKPNALRTLASSREFKRDRDNTVYHKGYPLNHRQQGGVPSVQISTTKDGARADIDVDYRSAKFPGALVNGHLSSANSDVRAGNNHARHINRWSGFADWWKNIFGVSLKEADLRDEDLRGRRGMIQPFPRVGRGKPEAAAYDFLNSWLVEQRPELAAAYLSPRAYACVEQVASDERKQINRGLIPYYVLEEMKRANRAVGKPARLGEAAEGVRPDNPALKPIAQPHRAEFEFFELPGYLASDFECGNRLHLRDAAEKEKPGSEGGKYYGASLRLKAPGAKGAALLLLWAKESGYWKVVSWNVEPDKVANEDAPDAADTGVDEQAEPERVAGDPAMTSAAREFFDDWFVRNNFEKAVGHFSARCFECVNRYLGEGERRARTWPEGRRKLRDGMMKVAKAVGRKGDAAEAITGLPPVHPLLKLVTHPDEGAYTLVGVPDEIAGAFACTNQVRSLRAAREIGGAATYGNYYGATFELRVRGAPAALNLLWGREAGRWKIVAYSIEVP